MRDDVNDRCVNHSCARALARQVNYCPYCGINQTTALPRPVEPRAGVASALGGAAAASAPVSASGTASVTAAGTASGTAADAAPGTASGTTPAAAEPSASASGFSTAGAADVSSARSAGSGGYASARQSPSPAPAQQAAAAAASARGPAAAPPITPAPAAAGSVPPAATRPPGPGPVRLRWILLALAAIWLVWVFQRPANPADARLEKRIDRAIGLARACKPNEAQAELIALQARATAAQLARLQGALDQADSACHPERASGNGAAGAGSASTTRRRPSSESARNLIAEARAAIARDDYRAAADKMEVCMTMVDGSPDECRVLKTRADRLDGERQRCLAGGLRWLGGQCQ